MHDMSRWHNGCCSEFPWWYCRDGRKKWVLEPFLVACPDTSRLTGPWTLADVKNGVGLVKLLSITMLNSSKIKPESISKNLNVFTVSACHDSLRYPAKYQNPVEFYLLHLQGQYHYDIALWYCTYRHCRNFWAFTRPRRQFGLILLILNIIHKGFTGATPFVSANIRGPVRFKAPHELWNPQSKAVPGKFHKCGGHSKCNCLQDRQFSQVFAG